MARSNDSRSRLVETMASLLHEQGYTATALAQVLDESGVSNGSLYHHFPGGMEELAEVALEASGQMVADVLRASLRNAPSTGDGVAAFLDIAANAPSIGCPIAPTALESPMISPRLRATAGRCFETWEGLIAERLRADGWPEESVTETASATLALIEGALLLARVRGSSTQLEHSKRAALTLLSLSAVHS